MTEALLFWMYLLALWQPRIATGRWPNRRRSVTFFTRQQRSLRRSRGSLTRLLFTSSLLVLPPFQQMIHSLQAPRRFWAAPRGQGFWKKNYVVYGMKWEDLILTGKRNSTCIIFASPKTPCGISPRRLASTSRNKIRICDVHNPLPRG